MEKLSLFWAASFAVVMAFFGALTRLAHEHAQGVQPINWLRVLTMFPSAVLFGVVGATGALWLVNSYAMPVEAIVLTGGALGGTLAYLGPPFIETVARAALERFGRGKPKDDTDG